MISFPVKQKPITLGNIVVLKIAAEEVKKKQKSHATVGMPQLNQANILRDLLGETWAALPREMTSALVVIMPAFNCNEWV